MLKDFLLDTAKAMARASIYDNAVFLGKWNGYNVFQPTFTDKRPRCIGFPQFILQKGGGMRWSESEEESRAIMKAFPTPDDETEEEIS